MEGIDDPIQVNTSFAELPDKLMIRACEMEVNFTDEEKEQGLKLEFWNSLNYPVLGYLSRGRLWYLGTASDVDNLVEGFSARLENDILISQHSRVEVSPENPYHRNIVSTLLNKRLTQELTEKGFLVDYRHKTALANPLLQDSDIPLLVHEEKFFEGFKYRMFVLEDLGISLQMDPVIRIFVPKAKMEPNEPILPACLKTECNRYLDCFNSLPRSIVMYCGDEHAPFSDCPVFEKASRVYNHWTGCEETVPKMALLGRTFDRSIAVRAKPYSLKLPADRWEWTQRFFEMLADNDLLSLDVCGRNVIFNSPFTEIPVADKRTEPYGGYLRAGDVQLLFGSNKKESDPYQGLTRFGALSSNRRDPRTAVSTITIFAILPDYLEHRTQFLLDRLKTGHYSYKGFHTDIPPFGVDMEYFTYALEFNDTESYVKRVQARIENIKNDYPLGLGSLLLLVIPSACNQFYTRMKSFTAIQGISNQMIDEVNIDRLANNFYLLLCFALSLYTKSGLTPWRIDSSYFDSADCYIGMAFSHLGSESGHRFFLGVADVFDSFGEYLSFALHEGSVNPSIRGLHVDREFMTTLVEQAIIRYKDKMENAPSTLFIHKPGRFLKEEIGGVSDALLQCESERALLIHVQHNSLFRAYNPSLEYQPVATTYFRIGSGNAVVLPTGYVESKDQKHKMGTPKPVQLNMRWVDDTGEVHYHVSDEALHFAVQNFLAFTRLRWSSLSSTVRDPLTIHAARVIADWQKEGIRGLEGLDIRDIL